MGHLTQLEILRGVGAAILLIGVGTDLLYRKFPNKFFVLLMTMALATVIASGGVVDLPKAILAAGTAFLIMVPLFAFRIVGGGDVKLLIAFAFTSSWQEVTGLVFFSIIWGAILGIASIIANKQLAGLSRNMFTLLSHRRAGIIQTHKIPFSIPLFLGWLTSISLQWGL